MRGDAPPQLLEDRSCSDFPRHEKSSNHAVDVESHCCSSRVRSLKKRTISGGASEALTRHLHTACLVESSLFSPGGCTRAPVPRRPVPRRPVPRPPSAPSAQCPVRPVPRQERTNGRVSLRRAAVDLSKTWFRAQSIRPDAGDEPLDPS